MAIYYAAHTGGFYVDGIHVEIPADAVEVAAEEHAALLEAQGQGLEIVPGPDGRPVAVKRVVTLADLVAAKRREILRAADAVLDAAASRYSSSERLTWPKQEAEAKALTQDPQAPAPLLRAIASARGIDVLVLRDKVLANVAAWEIVSGSAMGQQQAYEDALADAEALAETDPDGALAAIAAIVPAYSLPGA